MFYLQFISALILGVFLPVTGLVVAVHLRGTRDHGPDCRTCRVLGAVFDRPRCR